MEIVLTGDVPSKKNSKIVICRGKYPQLISSKNYRDWHEEKSWELKKYKVKVPMDNVKIIMTIYPRTKRKSDLSNKFESVADLLVDNGFIVDDNWWSVPAVVLMFGGVDKENPRCEISIK